MDMPLSELHPFPAHPFQVRDDDAMKETVESIKEYGVLVPAIVRPRADGGYELISGHRYKDNSRQDVGNLESAAIVGKDAGESGEQVQRYTWEHAGT